MRLRRSIGNDIGCCRFDRSQLNDQSVGQADDGQLAVADKALMDTELVRAVCSDDSNASGADFKLVKASVFTGDSKAVGSSDAVQGYTCQQAAVLINIRDVSCAVRSRMQYGDQTEEQDQA